MSSEHQEILRRYERRQSKCDRLYSPLSPSVYLPFQEKERAIIKWIRTCHIDPVGDKDVLEVGCGHGSNLLMFLKLGFAPERMLGIDLIPSRVETARKRLPSALRIVEGDATETSLGRQCFDVVYQSLVFSSILDDKYQDLLAVRMWDAVRPGGGVLWYDFLRGNPRNHDVRGVSVNRIRSLFPAAGMLSWSITVAPPISRLICGLGPFVYDAASCIKLVNTHVLCWLWKKAG